MARDVVQQNAEPVLVVVNPRAGRGRGVGLARELAKELQRCGVPFAVSHSQRSGDAETLAAQAKGAVLAVGGDGTVHEVLNGLRARDGRFGPLGVLPAGSGDDFAACAGFTRDPRALAERVRCGTTREVDTGLAAIECERGALARRFVNFAGIGFVAEIAARAHGARWPRGRALYLSATLRAWCRQHQVVCEQRFADGTIERRPLLFAAACNGARVGAGLRFSPDARLDDGQLDVLRVTSPSRRTTLSLLWRLLRRTHLDDPRVRLTRCTSVAVRPDAPLPVTLDGEPIATRATALDVRIAPERLLLFAP